MDGGEAASQAVSIDDLVDWDELRRLLDPVTLGAVCESFKGWQIGETGDLFLAVRTADEPGDPHPLIREAVASLSVIGLVEQLTIQERLRSLPAGALEALRVVLTGTDSL